MADTTPDFAVDYGLLHTVQSKLRDLADRAGEGLSSGAYHDLGEALASERRRVLGSADLSYQFNYFYTVAKDRQGSAKDGLNKLADLFQGVANAWFEADAQIAGGAGLLGDSLGLGEWKNEKAAYDKWLEDKKRWDRYLKSIGAAEYFREHPQADIATVCNADHAPSWCHAWLGADNPPHQPGTPPQRPPDSPPTHYHSQTPTGSVDVTVTLDDHDNVIKETYTVTTDGQTYTTTTDYNGPPQLRTPPSGGKPYDIRGYTVTTTGADGQQSVSKVVINDDGSGTMTVTQGSTVTTYTRTGPDASWTQVVSSQDDPNSSSNDPGFPTSIV